MNLPPPNVGWAPPGATAPQQLAPAIEATAQSILFDSATEAAAALAMQTDDSMLTNVPPIVRKAAQKEMQRAIVDVLDIGLVGIVHRGWQGHSGLKAAGQRTADGGREVVQLADHVINSSHAPSIAITVDGKELGSIPVAINISLKLMGINAIVERGHLCGIGAGSVAASANLAVAGKPVTSRTKTIEAARSLPIAKPLPLTS